jgi:predicted ATPase
MHLKSLMVRNFRALEEIEVTFDNRVNVIVGPNAIGKTTVLEAIRFAKAVLAPRTQNESSQVLFSLGAAVPYNPQQLIPEAIARDKTKPIEIRCLYELTKSEFDVIDNGIAEIATASVLARSGQRFLDPSASIAMLSSDKGRMALQEADSARREFAGDLRNGKQPCRLDLNIDPRNARFTAGEPIAPAFIQYLDRRLSPNVTLFSYFPADRALPSGESPVQLGLADAPNQLESHSSQPQLKYTRLKNMIFGSVVASASDRNELDEEFKRIFTGLLAGRKMADIGINPSGMLSIKVEDTETHRTFDLDGMSSGEKGLILTFLLIGRSLKDGGMILLDEPELHLNPAVCRNLLNFLLKEYAVRKDLQAIVCSHSPEILAGAFDSDECSLFHLVSGRTLTKVRYKDAEEISAALQRLGTSESEGLLYKATIFVEGEEDVDLLETGFNDLLRRYKVKDLGGRKEIEKQIQKLQALEKAGDKLSRRYFIFDRDDAPTGLHDSEAIRTLQWDRRCLENYLIDMDVLTDLLKNGEVVRAPLVNQADVFRTVKNLAMSQLIEFSARQVYNSYEFEDPGLRRQDIEGRSLDEISIGLFDRLQKSRSKLELVDPGSWRDEFKVACEKRKAELEPIWDAKWIDLCDGKRLFADLAQRLTLRMHVQKFKKRIMVEMRLASTATWRGIESLLKTLVQP